MLVAGLITTTTTVPPPVTVQAYTESLCIDCKNFFEKQLVESYQKLGSDVIDLSIVPFGNAILDEKKQSIICQHGEAECDANLWEQCAVELNEPPVYFEFIGCLESSLAMGHRDEPFDESFFKDCADLAMINFPELKKCHDNPFRSYLLQLKYAKLTPNHDHVPWVLINGKKFDENKQDLFEEICKEYKAGGGSNPACSNIVWED